MSSPTTLPGNLSTVEVRGPFFDTNAGRVINAAIAKAVSNVATAGVAEVRGELTPGHGVASGAFRKGVHKSQRGLTAKVLAKNTMIALWLQGIQKRNFTTRFKGWQIFTAAARATDQGAGEKARAIVRELVRQLGG